VVHRKSDRRTKERVQRYEYQPTKGLVHILPRKSLQISLHQINNIMKINQYRIRKSWECFKHHMKNGDGLYWSVKLSLWWFGSKFTFLNDSK